MTEGAEGEAWVLPPQAHTDLKCAELVPETPKPQTTAHSAPAAADDEDCIPDIDDMQAEDFDEVLHSAAAAVCWSAVLCIA